MNKNIKRLWKVLMTIVVTVGMVFSYGMPVFAVDSATDDPIQTKLQQVYDEITSDETLQGADLAEAFIDYIADTTDYSARYSSLNGILTTNSGDCWASVAYFNALCEMAGFEVRTRNATADTGAGSGHRNSVVKVDGKYYIADSGYSGTAPRYRSFKEEVDGLYLNNRGVLIQYDAFDVKDVVIPSVSNGITITDIGVDSLDRTVFGLYDNVTSVTLPDTITHITDVAFNSCPDLQNIYVDDGNTTYYDVDGVLYAYDGRLMKIPEARSEVVIEPGTTSIEDFAFYGTGKIAITIPSSVTSFEKFTFNNCTPTIYAEEGSYAAAYAAEHGIAFVATHLDHTAGEPKQENYVAPTCTEDGYYDSVIRCTVCGEPMFSSRVTLPATGHTPGELQHENEVPPTCTEAGSYDEVIRCTVCGDVISSNQVSVDATGHTPGEPVQEITKAPTCEESGTYDMVTYCETCGDEINRVSNPDYVIAPTGHTANDPVRENVVNPTCTKEGSYDEVVYCGICGKEMSREHKVIDALGHTPGEPVIENENLPSCDEGGSYQEVVYCDTCGEELSRVDHSVDPTAHTPSEAVKINIVEPTCTEEGSYDEVVYCSVCDNVISSKHVIVDAKGHTPDEEKGITDIIEPTCTESGSYVEITYCADCGIELERKTVLVDPTGHPEESYEIRGDYKPTCTELGYTGDTYCGICGDLVSHGEYIDMIPHNYVDDICTECGAYNYKITDESADWVAGSDESLVINTNGDVDTLLAVYIDGKLLDEDSYIISGDNASIELSVEFLKTLATGTHTIEVQWEAGAAKSDFTVSPEQVVDDNPGKVDEVTGTKPSDTQTGAKDTGNSNASTSAVATGDDVFVGYSLLGLLLSGAFAAYISRKRKQI